MDHLVRNLVLFTLFGLAFSKIRKVDLTYTLNEDSPGYPSMPRFNLTIIHRGPVEGQSYWLEFNSVSFGEHLGTHMDAPAHFFKGSEHAADIPVDKFINRGVVLDVVSKASANPDYAVSLDDVKKWESEFGKIPEKAIVLMNSGWSAKHPDKTKIFGTTTINDSTTFHFPGFHVDAISWLIRERKISMIGTDTPSSDPGQSTTYPVHVLVGKNNIPGLENLANLGSIPQKGATIFIGAVKMEDASAAPIRAIAIYDDDASGATNASPRGILMLFVAVVFFCITI